MTTYTGIDYGLGRTNIDTETGIRYGVLSANHEALTEWFWESVETHYIPRCPKCGNDDITLDDDETEDWEEAKYDCIEFGCESCRYLFGESAYGDEPDSSEIDSDGVKGFVDSSNDLWIVKSPYYTHAQFCSPCAPGAGYLGTPCESGPKTYCLGPDWFVDEKPPYPVFRVDTDECVSD